MADTGGEQDFAPGVIVANRRAESRIGRGLPVPIQQEKIARLLIRAAQVRARASLDNLVNGLVLTRCARFESYSGARAVPLRPIRAVTIDARH